MNSGRASIRSVNSFVFNTKFDRYEQVPSGFLSGKSSTEIADEYGLTSVRIRQYALEKKLPYIGTVDKVNFYVFDEAAEEAFKNRKTTPGREAVEKPPKVPGKPGRPRKEKLAISVAKKPSVTAGPKNPVGRPRKNPKEPLDIVKRSRGRPRK
jgi:hypothetical protein